MQRTGFSASLSYLVTFSVGLLFFPHSVDAGSSPFVSLGPGGGGAQLCAAIHPQDADIMLLGQDVGGVLKTTNGGASWTHVNTGMALPRASTGSMGVQELKFSKTDPSIVFASTWDGLFRSTDTAETWTRVFPAGDTPGNIEEPIFSCVAIDPDGQTVWAGTGDPFEDSEGFGLLRSNDGGQTFQIVAGSGIPAAAVFGRLLVDPESPAGSRHVYAATSQGLYRSLDGGTSFNTANNGLGHTNVREIALSGSGAQRRFWVALQTNSGSGGVYHSSDGTNWTNASSGLQLKRGGFAQRMYGLAVHPSDTNTAYVAMRDLEGEFGGVFGTQNGGSSWSKTTPTFPGVGYFPEWEISPEGLALAPSRPGRILVTVESQPMMTDDGGQGWRGTGTHDNPDGTFSGTGVEVTFVYDLGSTANSAGRIYASYEDIGFWRSDDWGASWRQLFYEYGSGTSLSDGSVEVHVHPENSDELYAVAGSWSNGIRGDGASWLLHSRDAGETWNNLTDSFSSSSGRGCAAVDFSKPEASRTVIFGQHGGTVRRSENGGQSWSTAANGFEGDDSKRIFAIAFDPDHAGRVYAGTHSDFGAQGSGGGLYRSDDDGQTWTKLGAFPHTDVNTIEFLGSPRRLFVGGSSYHADVDEISGALMASDDGGASFTSVLGQPYVLALVELPGHPGSLVAGAGAHYFPAPDQYAGLYRSDDNGNSWTLLDLTLPHTGILTLMAPAWDPDQLYMGTRGDGLKRVSLSGVSGGNRPPRASAGSDQNVPLPEGAATVQVTLDGSASFDLDGVLTGYVWTGTPDPEDTPSPTLTLGSGEFIFTLTVTDDQGATATDSVRIVVGGAGTSPGTLLTVVVRDMETGESLEDVKVRVKRLGRPRYREWDFTPSNGMLSFGGFPEAGTFLVVARKRRYRRVKEWVEWDGALPMFMELLLESRRPR